MKAIDVGHDAALRPVSPQNVVGHGQRPLIGHVFEEADVRPEDIVERRVHVSGMRFAPRPVEPLDGVCNRSGPRSIPGYPPAPALMVIALSTLGGDRLDLNYTRMNQRSSRTGGRNSGWCRCYRARSGPSLRNRFQLYSAVAVIAQDWRAPEQAWRREVREVVGRVVAGSSPTWLT